MGISGEKDSYTIDGVLYVRANEQDGGLILERQEAIRELRILCASFGDNDWPEDLHLADIIDKHLGKHLYEQGR